MGRYRDHRSRFGLNLLLDLAAKAIGVAKADLDLGLLIRRSKIADVRFARKRGGENRQPLRRIVRCGSGL